MAQKLLIEDGSGDKDFFTIVPNYILNHSTAADQALYLQLKRLAGDGKRNYCYPSIRYLKKQLGIGEIVIKKSLKYLTDHKWIDSLGKRRVMTGGGMQWVSAYKINNIWPLNTEYYKGVSKSDPLPEVSPEKPKVLSEMGKVLSVIGAKEERKKELIKERVCFQLKDWNERQSSPIPNFVPKNIVNKYGPEKVELLIKHYGQENMGFSLMLKNLKEK